MPFADAANLISMEINNNTLLRYITLQWCIMFKAATTIHSAGIQKGNANESVYVQK